jgi:tetratricopeptide (TPR) repeat protein
MSIMHKLCCLSLALSCLTLSTPAWSDDDSTAQQDKQAKKTNSKKTKPSKTENASSGSSSSSLDSELDKVLGRPTVKGPTPAADDSVPQVNDRSSALPPSSSTAPDANGGTTKSRSSSPATSEQQNSSDSGDITIDENKIPAKTLQAGELNNEAVTALNNKQFQKAIDLLLQALAVDPSYTQGKGNLCVANYNFALSLYDNGKFAEALPLFQKALDLAKQLNRDDNDIRKYYEDCRKSANQQTKH